MNPSLQWLYVVGSNKHSGMLPDYRGPTLAQNQYQVTVLIYQTSQYTVSSVCESMTLYLDLPVLCKTVCMLHMLLQAYTLQRPVEWMDHGTWCIPSIWITSRCWYHVSARVKTSKEQTCTLLRLTTHWSSGADIMLYINMNENLANLWCFASTNDNPFPWT